MHYRAYVFDAYGTLFDVHSAVRRHGGLLGVSAGRISEIWRNKQLEYTWTRSLIGKYADFWKLTEQALDFALATANVSAGEIKKTLMSAYRELDCFPEVPMLLAQLRETGAKLAILSNGSPQMLSDAVDSAKIGTLLDHVISVDSLQRYKPLPEVYRLASDLLNAAPNEIAFQSSNRWDIAGASAFGFRCHWINRTNQPDEYADMGPVRVISTLNELVKNPS